jgi:hypothetical protein
MTCVNLTSAMAVLPVIPNTYRVALRWSHLGGGNAVNVIHVRNATGYPNQPAVFTCLDAHVTIPMWETVEPNTKVTQVDVTPLDGVSATESFFPAAVAKWAGAGIGDPVPAVATLVKLQTAKRGREHRGRVFLPMTSEGVMNNGVIASSALTPCDAAWKAFIIAIGTDATFPLTWGVASYKLASFEPIINVAVEALVGTQRRRQERLRA